jgi:hypothetical protein
MVEEQIRICPQFEKSIHCVFSRDDYVPLMIHCLDLLGRQPPKPKELNSAGGVKHHARGKYLSQSGGDLFSNPFVKNFLKNLSTLQEYPSDHAKVFHRVHSQQAKKAQQDARKRAADAVESLKKALQGIAVYYEQIEGILYGKNSYLMSTDKEEGAKWKQQPRHLAAIELSQHTKHVHVSEDLFQLHTMDAYMQLIFRSYLEKLPDKYIIPNQEKAVRYINELAFLKPKVTGLDIHEYPNERVLVLKGENLWFSYKICFNESHEIDTPAENTTKSMIEFHITHIHEAYSTLCSGKQLKIALFTHFAKPIRQSIDSKKVRNNVYYTLEWN